MARNSRILFTLVIFKVTKPLIAQTFQTEDNPNFGPLSLSSHISCRLHFQCWWKLWSNTGNQGNSLSHWWCSLETPRHLPQLLWDGRGVLSLRRADLCHEVRQLDVRRLPGGSTHISHVFFFGKDLIIFSNLVKIQLSFFLVKSSRKLSEVVLWCSSEDFFLNLTSDTTAASRDYTYSLLDDKY